ncbi:hypothetical protein [Rhizohabitans arisaemae]|uniref:hypothetical protein n=1 Tax=Rhizohabitans arisaemae TaxID=2720610 RepID=UPI0024B276DB|nr:hypothetical protein [Rhizohabitans arisaemae]
MVRRTLALAAAAILAALAMFTATAPAQAATLGKTAAAATAYEDVLYSPMVAGQWCSSRYGSSYDVAAYDGSTLYCYSWRGRTSADAYSICKYFRPSSVVLSYFRDPSGSSALVCRFQI